MIENNPSDKSFYDELWELLETELGDTVLCDQMADRIYDLIKEHDAAPMIAEAIKESLEQNKE